MLNDNRLVIPSFTLSFSIHGSHECCSSCVLQASLPWRPVWKRFGPDASQLPSLRSLCFPDGACATAEPCACAMTFLWWAHVQSLVFGCSTTEDVTTDYTKDHFPSWRQRELSSRLRDSGRLQFFATSLKQKTEPLLSHRWPRACSPRAASQVSCDWLQRQFHHRLRMFKELFARACQFHLSQFEVLTFMWYNLTLTHVVRKSLVTDFRTFSPSLCSTQNMIDNFVHHKI